MRGDPSLRRNVDLSVWATTNTIGILIETVMGFESSDPVASRQYIDALNEWVIFVFYIYTYKRL